MLFPSIVQPAQSVPVEKPSWLDTIAPKVTINPLETIHRDVFSVEIKSSESGTIWYGIGNKKSLKQYKKPFSLTKDGTWQVFFNAEDDFGNVSQLDSITYVVDTKSPSFSITPPPGAFREPVLVHVNANEACSFFLISRDSNELPIQFSDSILIRNTKEFRIKAVDIAGNLNVSKPYMYIIDTTAFNFSIDPAGGIYNHPVYISYKYAKDITVWYTFDPLASQKWFTQYKEPVKLPYGLSSIRYFAKSQSGFSTDILNSRYIIDTIPPKLTKKITSGHFEDTIQFSCREKVDIRFTRDGTLPVKESPLYEKPISIKKSGVQRVKARAWDIAGNSSEIIEWEYKYDLIPPELTIIPESGTYTTPFTTKITANEPSRILYTLDGTEPGKNALLYQPEGITITRNDTTRVRVVGVDSAGNKSVEYIRVYYLDSKPPTLRTRIDGTLKDEMFTVSLSTDEPSEIFYEIGGADPSSGSTVYKQPLKMSTNQILKYYAVDKLGNRSTIYTMDELRRPMVESIPVAGIFNHKIGITFKTNSAGTVFWRILPDTLFKPADSSEIVINKEGISTFEYYLQTSGGLRGSTYRQEYQIDWTPPTVDVRTRKGINDSAIVFLKSNERATFYYTTDGTNPLVSSTVNTAGNKFLLNNDRIVFKKDLGMKFSIFAEDIAGNQSSLSVLDIFSPRAIPDVPASKFTVYDKPVSISFHTIDESSVFYSTDGTVPTQNYTIFTKPITLMTSDTIYTLAIDGSGFTGKVDTFIYRIDLPPTPLFSIANKEYFVNDTVRFDASESFDKESPQSKLRFLWNFDGDSTFDTDTIKITNASHKFTKPGFYKVTLKIIDEMHRSAAITNDCVVHERCPDDMVSIDLENQKQFCIDKYEWPNTKKSVPITGVSWVEAKVFCIDAGKRLCTAMEWESACNGSSNLLYPYGNQFEKERCPVEGKSPWKAGSFSNCEKTGTFDMVGNVWEWVENKNGDYPLSMGGSFRYGKLARCGLQSQGTVATQSNETGFRCCK
jgi:hypothetical protein